MMSNTSANEFKYSSKRLIFYILQLLLGSLSANRLHANSTSQQVIVKDTVPHAELYNFNRNKGDRLYASNGVLIAKLGNGDSLIIARKAYEDYARKNAEAEDDDKTFTRVEIEPEYPGGTDAWSQYVKKNIHYPEAARENGIQDTVFVQFIVEQDGTLREVEAVGGPVTGGLRDEAIRLVKMSGKWNAAIQNFRIVRAYKKQAVVFVSEKR